MTSARNNTCTLTQEERHTLRQLISVVEEVRKEHPRMELGQLSLLLLVLLEPGATGTDLSKKVDLKKSAVSRNILALSVASYQRDEEGSPRPGLNLIAQLPSGMDARQNELHPTEKGTRFARKLASLMRG